MAKPPEAREARRVDTPVGAEHHLHEAATDSHHDTCRTHTSPPRHFVAFVASSNPRPADGDRTDRSRRDSAAHHRTGRRYRIKIGTPSHHTANQEKGRPQDKTPAQPV